MTHDQPKRYRSQKSRELVDRVDMGFDWARQALWLPKSSINGDVIGLLISPACGQDHFLHAISLVVWGIKSSFVKLLWSRVASRAACNVRSNLGPAACPGYKLDDALTLNCLIFLSPGPSHPEEPATTPHSCYPPIVCTDTRHRDPNKGRPSSVLHRRQRSPRRLTTTTQITDQP